MVGIPPKTFEHAHSMMDELINQNDMQQDTTKGFMDKTFTEAFITAPWLADTWKSFKKPFVADYLRELLNMPAPMKHSIGSDYYNDLNTNTDKQQELLEQVRNYGHPQVEQ